MERRTRLGGRAIVVGGGMAGLFSARVLSDHFDEVIVLDRDHEPTTAEPRGTVPQGHHFHVLLPGGLDAMKDWFPGFIGDLVDTASVEMRLGRDFYAYTPQGRSYSLQSHVPEPIDGGALTYVQTRPQLELTVRRRVASVANVTLRYRALVDGPVTADDRVVGVHVRDADPITADLVVDASGRNSCTARWLPDMGFPTAPETYVNCDVSYASVICQPNDWHAFEGTVIFVMPSGDGAHSSRMGSIVKLPHGKWLVMLGGRYGDNPPTEWDDFRGFGRTLVAPVWADLVETVTPVADIKAYRMPRAVRHHYEQMERFPDGLLPIGDSVCFFNPTHGQGMSSAAGQVRGLQSLLAGRAADSRGLEGLAMDFFPIAEDWVRGPWILAAMGDFEHPECTGDFPEADLPDLMLLGTAAGAGATSPETLRLVNDIATLRKPLSAIRALTTA
jgi:2-polyprenyl-6-methoxyphenol hydroxylase-like FAD-dependent oxidoreductase